MLLRCIKSFETREGGVARTIDEGTVWYKARHDIARGGYELVIIERVEGGAFTGVMATVRLDKVMDPELFEPVPPSQETVPIGVTEYFAED
jgi:hypothetical protein